MIKADVGGYPGHSSVHPALIETAESKLAQAKKSGALIDFRVLACGDDLELIMSHKKGCDNGEVHGLAWETFEKATEVAKKLKLYGAGQDPACRCLQRQHQGPGPGVAEMEFTERTAEPIVAFMMDKTELGAFNLPISVDLFKDLAFDNARRKALDITDYLREHGPFEPHRLPMEDMEYTTLPHVMKNLASRFADTE